MDPHQSTASGAPDEAVVDLEWNVNSPARVFANPRPLIQRAWERKPRPRHAPADSTSSDSVSGKPRTIWKRYDPQLLTLKQAPLSAKHESTHATKVVKKLKVASDTHLTAAVSPLEMPSKWGRRRSSLPHKLSNNLHPAPFTLPSASPVDDEQPAQLRESCPQNQSQQAEASVQLAATNEAPESTSDKNTKSRPRKRLSKSSLFSRRKTDFVFSRTAVPSPSRKRRLSDTFDNTKRSISITALDVSKPSLQSEPTSAPAMGEPTETPVLDPPAIEIGAQVAAMPSSPGGLPEQPTASLIPSQLGANVPSLSRATEGSDNAIQHLPTQESEEIVSTPPVEVRRSPEKGLDAATTPAIEEAIQEAIAEPPRPSNLPYTTDEPDSTVKIVLNDDDTDILHDFLNRAKASKAAKIAEQSAELNRRDSDIVKTALASPRKPLDELDANSPSPRKPQTLLSVDSDLNSRLNQSKETSPDLQHKPTGPSDGFGPSEPDQVPTPEPPTRRSKRNAYCPPVPARSSSQDAAPLSTISLRRQDQPDPVVLKKSEAQELALLTRTNTRRNKGSALPVHSMLDRLKLLSQEDGSAVGDCLKDQTKVHWNENLVAYFEEDNTIQQLSENGDASTGADAAEVSRPRARRAKMLGAMNGTPAKQRTKDLNATALMGNYPAADLESTVAISAERAPGNDESKSQAPTQPKGKSAESNQKQASYRLRRIPTPAKPGKLDGQSQPREPVKTRQNTAPEQKLLDTTTAEDDDKENSGPDPAAVSKHEAAPRTGVHLRSGAVPAASAGSTAGEARRRPGPPRRAATAATGPGASSSSKATARLRK